MAFREMVTLNLVKPDVLFTEFISADGIVYNKKHIVGDKLTYSENQRPIVAQIWGANPDNFEKAAGIIQELGFDGIDINMGCPDKHVMKTGGGGKLIINQPLAEKIILAVKKGTKLPVSVKTRLGYDKVITGEWFPFLLEQKLAAISVHARTTKQLSKGKPVWDEISKIVELRNKVSPETLIIGNGNIDSYDEAIKARETYRVDGVMIGRGIFKNPFVFDPEPHKLTKAGKIELLEKHLELIQEHGGMINKFLKVYLKGFSNAKDLRIKYLNQNTV